MRLGNGLVYKWLVGNSFAFLGLYIAWLQGWVHLVFRSDASYLTIAMAMVFAVFWGLSAYQTALLNREANRFQARSPEGLAADYFAKLQEKARRQGDGRVDQAMLANALRARLQVWIQPVQYSAHAMILLGLIGTVIGFVIAVRGLGDAISQGDNAEQVKAVLAQIVDGMGVALFTTLVGSILGGLWLQIHYQVLARAASHLTIDVVERAELEVLPRLAAHGAPAAPAEARRAEGASAEWMPPDVADEPA